jgi:predicted GNAT family N-acyltransferase
MVLAVRSVKAEEAEKLIEFLSEINGHVYKASAEEYVHAMFTDSFRKPHFVIALDSDDIIGAAAYSEEIFTVNIWGLSWVSVNEASRHKNLRRFLVEECFRQIERKVKNSVTVILAALPHRAEAYKKLGFNPVGNGDAGRQFMALTLHKSIH